MLLSVDDITTLLCVPEIVLLLLFTPVMEVVAAWVTLPQDISSSKMCGMICEGRSLEDVIKSRSASEKSLL